MALATVVSVTGTAWVRNPDGSLNVLEAGAELQPGQIIIAAEGILVELDYGDGESVFFRGEQSLFITAETDKDAFLTAQEAALFDDSVQSVLQALEDGGDLLDVLEATAAGSAPNASGAASSRAARLFQNSGNGETNEFDFGNGAQGSSAQGFGLAGGAGLGGQDSSETQADETTTTSPQDNTVPGNDSEQDGGASVPVTDEDDTSVVPDENDDDVVDMPVDGDEDTAPGEDGDDTVVPGDDDDSDEDGDDTVVPGDGDDTDEDGDDTAAPGDDDDADEDGDDTVVPGEDDDADEDGDDTVVPGEDDDADEDGDDTVVPGDDDDADEDGDDTAAPGDDDDSDEDGDDTTAPAISEVVVAQQDTSNPANGEADQTVVTFSGDDANATYVVTGANGETPTVVDNEDGTYTAIFSPALAAGTEVTVTATDPAGNVSTNTTGTVPAEVTYAGEDTTAPTISEVVVA
ncbi:MAG: retention module-containing protein, partial [Natronospirillum sp.]